MAGTAAAAPRRGRVAVEWLALVVLVAATAFLVRTFVVEPFAIPSTSMAPTIRPGDRVLVDKLAYSIHRGDIIVFKRQPDDHDPEIADLIKRVIGLPGQTLRSGPHGEVFVNGRLVAQPWLTPAAEADPGPTICDPAPGDSQVDCTGDVLHLPKGEYYVMGDNRGVSDDSRYWGPVSARSIIGLAFVRIWPLSRLHWF